MKYRKGMDPVETSRPVSAGGRLGAFDVLSSLMSMAGGSRSGGSICAVSEGHDHVNMMSGSVQPMVAAAVVGGRRWRVH